MTPTVPEGIEVSQCWLAPARASCQVLTADIVINPHDGPNV